jgi:hypothetical protein
MMTPWLTDWVRSVASLPMRSINCVQKACTGDACHCALVGDAHYAVRVSLRPGECRVNQVQHSGDHVERRGGFRSCVVLHCLPARREVKIARTCGGGSSPVHRRHVGASRSRLHRLFRWRSFCRERLTRSGAPSCSRFARHAATQQGWRPIPAPESCGSS